MFELLLTFLLGVLLSSIAFIYTRRSLTTIDDVHIIKDADSKAKNKSSKKPTLVREKKAKPETLFKNKEVKETEIAPVKVENKRKKEKSISKDFVLETTAEKTGTESITEWTKVSKVTKKVGKKETAKSNAKSADFGIQHVDNNLKELEDTKQVNLPKESVKEVKVEKKVLMSTEKSKTETKQLSTVIPKAEGRRDKEPGKRDMSENVIVAPMEVSRADSTDQNFVNNDNDLRRRVGELMTEIDRMKLANKEDNKSSSQLLKEVDTLKSKLKASQAAEQKLMDDLKKRTAAVNDLKTQFQIVQSELTKNIVQNQALSRDKQGLESKTRSLAEENEQLIMNCHITEELKTANNVLNDKVVQLERQLEEVQSNFSIKFKSQETETVNQVNTLQSEKQKLQEQLVRVQTELIDNINKIQLLQQEILSSKTSLSDVLNEKVQLEKSIMLLKEKETKNADNQQSVLDAKIIQLTNEIDSLRIANERLVKEKELVEGQLEKTESNHAQIVNNLNDKLNKLQSEFHSCQLETVDRLQSNKEISTKLFDLQEENRELSEMVEKYKQGLESTEHILSKLQCSVNEEESKWRESLMKSEAESERSKQELENVFNHLMRIKNARAESNDLNFAYHCVDKSLSSLIDEMEARMNHFESCFEKVVQERDNALAHTTKINGAIGADLSVEADRDELDELRADLNKEREMNKTLENNCNKYRALLDIGKDALEAETLKVTELKEALRELQSQSSVSNHDVSYSQTETS